MILAATISVIACHAKTEKQADAGGKHDSQCNRKALLTPNKQRHKDSPKRAKPYSSEGKGAPERHEVRRGCIDTKAPEQTQIRRFIIAAPHASIGQDCKRFSTASIVGHGGRLTDGFQSYRSRSKKKGALFHITLNDRSWPTPALAYSCHGPFGAFFERECPPSDCRGCFRRSSSAPVPVIWSMTLIRALMRSVGTVRPRQPV